MPARRQVHTKNTKRPLNVVSRKRCQHVDTFTQKNTKRPLNVVSRKRCQHVRQVYTNNTKRPLNAVSRKRSQHVRQVYTKNTIRTLNVVSLPCVKFQCLYPFPVHALFKHVPIPLPISRTRSFQTGASTLDKYKKTIEKDPALERRFQQVSF